jgi:putative acetyltransferase
MAETGFHIRPVAHGDFAQLSALLNGRATGPAISEVSRLPESLRRRIEGDDLHGFRLVAVDADLIIGQAGVTFAAPATGWVTLLVRNDQRRRGVGKALLAAVLTAARQAGLRRIETDVFKDNAPALALYRQLGFQDISAGQSAGSVKMEKIL